MMGFCEMSLQFFYFLLIFKIFKGNFSDFSCDFGGRVTVTIAKGNGINIFRRNKNCHRFIAKKMTSVFSRKLSRHIFYVPSITIRDFFSIVKFVFSKSFFQALFFNNLFCVKAFCHCNKSSVVDINAPDENGILQLITVLFTYPLSFL